MSKRFPLVVIVGMLLALSARGQTQPPAETSADDSVEAQLQEAWYLEVASGRYEEALAIYRRVLEVDPIGPIVRALTQLRMALTLSRLGRLEESRALLRELLAKYAVASDSASNQEKHAELVQKVRDLERTHEHNAKLYTANHPVLRRTQGELEKVRAEIAALTILTDAQRAELQPILDAAQEALTGSDTEQASLRRKVVSLIERLNAEDEAVRKQAAEALMGIGSDVAPFLVEALTTSDYFASQEVARLLVDFAGRDATLLPVLRNALRSADTVVQQALQTFLKKKPWNAEVVFSFLEDESAAVRAIGVDLWPGSEDAQRFPDRLARRMDDSSATVRAQTVQLLLMWEYRFPEFRAASSKALSDDDPRVRTAFFEKAAQRRQGFDQWIEAAVDALDPAQPDVARAAVEALNRWSQHRQPLFEEPAVLASCVERLIALSEGAPVELRQWVMSTLGQLPTERARDFLLRNLDDPLPSVARSALGALDGRLSDPLVAQRFIELASDPILGSNVQSRLEQHVREPVVRDLLFAHLTELPDSLIDKALVQSDRESVSKTIGSLEGFERLSPSVQVKVLRIIGNLKIEAAVPAVAQALRSDDRAVVDQALWAAQSVHSPVLAPALAQILNRGDSKQVNTALYIADKLDVPELIEPIGRHVRSEDGPTRDRAVSALDDIEDARVLPYLVEALTDPNTNAVNRASNAIDRLVKNGVGVRLAIDTMLERLPDLNVQAWKTFHRTLNRSAQAEDSQRLIAALELAPTGLQVQILQLLRGLAGPSALPSVRRYAQSGDEQVRHNAELLLLQIGEFDDLVALVPGQGSKAIHSLGASGDPRAFDVLLSLLKEGRENGQRHAAAMAIDRLARPEAIPDLVEFTLSQVWKNNNQIPMVRSLAKYPAEAALDGLAELLSRAKEPIVRIEALETLTRFAEPRARQLVLEQLEADDADVRAKAIEALGTFLDEDLLPRLVELLRHRLPEVRQAAQGSIQKIRFYLDQKRFAESVHGGSSSPEALQELTAMLSDPASSVRIAGAQALGRLGSEAALPALLRVRKDEDAAVRAAIEAALDAIVK